MIGLDTNSLSILCEGSCTSPHEELLDDTLPSLRCATFKIFLVRCDLLDDSCVTRKSGLRLSKGKALVSVCAAVWVLWNPSGFSGSRHMDFLGGNGATLRGYQVEEERCP